jgi:hypothetical protein
VNERTRTNITLSDLRTRRDEILKLAEKHGATHVRVFGSLARGEATPESDVDLLVSVREGVSMFDLVGLWQDLQALLGCEVSLVTDGIPDSRFLGRIEPDLTEL